MKGIYIARHGGMVGGAILRRLEARQAAGAALPLIFRTHSHQGWPEPKGRLRQETRGKTDAR